MSYQEFVNAILQALFPLLVAVVTAASAALAQKIHAYLVAKYSAEQLSLGGRLASDAVQFVEQVFVDVHGQEKLDAALKQAKDFGARYGVRYTDEQWRVLIESALKQLNDFWKAEEKA